MPKSSFSYAQSRCLADLNGALIMGGGGVPVPVPSDGSISPSEVRQEKQQYLRWPEDLRMLTGFSINSLNAF